MLDRQTLVLNRSWTPVMTTTVRRAIGLLARGAAAAVHPRTYETADWDGWIERGPDHAGCLRGVDFLFPVPEVIVLRAYNGFPRVAVRFSRRNVYRRDGYACAYCGRSPHVRELTIDHVVPRSHGGSTSWENCVTACGGCNARKADRSPEKAGMALRRSPRSPIWPGGLDPSLLASRPTWRQFVPASRALQA